MTTLCVVGSEQLPKLLELVGLGYTGWFVYRYLLFKVTRPPCIGTFYSIELPDNLFTWKLLFFVLITGE
jgi:hypothetical protein